MNVSFLRLNRNVWVATFIGMTEAQVSLALSTLSKDFSTIDHSSHHTFTATSINTPGYVVVQLDRTGSPIPPSVKDLLRKAVNDVYSGVLK